MAKLRWEDMSARLRESVAVRFGEVLSAEPAPCGSGSDVATTLNTAMGTVFLKGIRLDHPRADVRRIEQKVQTYLPELAPRLLWHAEIDRWLVLVFEHVDGRHADLRPGSEDLPLVARTLSELSTVARPDLPVLPIDKRWARFAEESSLARLRGSTLVHADLTAGNILIGDRVRIVDWAWPSIGAAWLDTAFMIVRLIQAGHTAREAEAWANQIPAWRTAEDEAVAVFIAARMALADVQAHESLGHVLAAWSQSRPTVSRSA